MKEDELSTKRGKKHQSCDYLVGNASENLTPETDMVVSQENKSGELMELQKNGKVGHP